VLLLFSCDFFIKSADAHATLLLLLSPFPTESQSSLQKPNPSKLSKFVKLTPAARHCPVQTLIVSSVPNYWFTHRLATSDHCFHPDQSSARTYLVSVITNSSFHCASCASDSILLQIALLALLELPLGRVQSVIPIPRTFVDSKQLLTLSLLCQQHPIPRTQPLIDNQPLPTSSSHKQLLGRPLTLTSRKSSHTTPRLVGQQTGELIRVSTFRLST